MKKIIKIIFPSILMILLIYLWKDGKDILLHQIDNVFNVIDVINDNEIVTFSFYVDENYDLAGVQFA